jgi:hypothetical protein
MDGADHEQVTKELARQSGFPAELIAPLAKAVRAVDTERDAQGRKKYCDKLYHTKTCPFCDLRRGAAQYRLGQAVDSWRAGDRDGAVASLGAGLHALQDLIAHGGLVRSVLLHRKRGQWAWLAPVQSALGLRDIDDYETMPAGLKNKVRQETMDYIKRFLEATDGAGGYGISE